MTMRSDQDQKLLSEFAPVIRFTRGEKFFPTTVNSYVYESSLWVHRPEQPSECLVQEKMLDLEKLGEARSELFGAVYFLRFIEPLNLAQLANYRLQQALKKKDPSQEFRAGRGRLARVGYASRFIDALFSISLLARGRVPGDTALAAAMTFQEMQKRQENYSYYGRVIRKQNWTILQYWYFYAYNNWRSGFFGANDHEADWEMINIYLYEGDDHELVPEWVAYANHDFSGDDLRRHWDDPELEKIGCHPVIYAAAGSHASYYTAGEYLTQVEIPFLSPLVKLVDYIQILWRRLLKQTRVVSENDGIPSSFNVFRIPFVDYARGNGFSIGYGGAASWNEPLLIEPAPGWVTDFRGLWGYYARDPIAGENAPAGPRYNRDGSVRRAWYDPIGWAGLDKVPTPPEVRELYKKRQKQIRDEQRSLRRSITQKQNQLRILGVEASAMRGHPHLKTTYQEHIAQIALLSDELNQDLAKLAEEESVLEALGHYSQSLNTAKNADLRTHINKAIIPESPKLMRINRLAETWAALSIGLTMIGIVALVIFGRQYIAFGLIIMLSLTIFIEAGFRRQFTKLISTITILLSILAAFILLYEFFWTIVIIAVLIAGGYMIWENLSELWS
jgi:hypothetical protein